MNRYLILLLLIVVARLHAQKKGEGATFLDRTAFKAGYYGDVFSDNGLQLGAEYLWLEKQRTKSKQRGPKTTTHQLLINGSLGYSTNFNNRTDNALHTYYGLVYRRTSSKRWQLHVELNPLGYSRSFLSETFEVEGDAVSRVRFPGRSYYAPSIGFGLGRSRKNNRLAGWYLNFNYTSILPYNAGILPTFSVQYGHRFNFKKKNK